MTAIHSEDMRDVQPFCKCYDDTIYKINAAIRVVFHGFQRSLEVGLRHIYNWELAVQDRT